MDSNIKGISKNVIALMVIIVILILALGYSILKPTTEIILEPTPTQDAPKPDNEASGIPINQARSILSQEQAQTLVIQTWGGCTPDTCSKVTVTVQNNNEQFIVTAIYSGLRDDSTFASRKVAIATYANDKWTLGTPTVTQQCQSGRGHQDFSTALCF